MPPDLKRAYDAELGVTLVESYGRSELGGFVALGYPRRTEEERISAIGPCLPDKEVRIVDEADNEVSVGTPGEIVLRGGFMAGYWRMPEETLQTLRDGWLHIGDMGFMDTEAYIHMLGRWSERIVCAGRVVYPRQMEECLLRHQAVLHAVVIGRPDPVKGEIPKAVAQLREGSSATSDELLGHCRGALGAPLSPVSVEIVARMPMTPTGKIARSELQRRERAS